MSAIDPVLVTILQRRLKSLAEKMGLTLLRTTRSPILNEARDFVTGLYDAEGRMMEQCEYTPILAFALQPACKYIVDYYGDDLAPGDIILHNDVYSQGGQLPDVAVFKPIFHGGQLVAWAAVKGHQADIGGAQAGGYNPNAREVWQEGLRIPPVKVYEAGKLRRDVWDLIFANIRFPVVEADIQAAIGGATVGERGILELVDRFGLDSFLTHLHESYDATERMMRSQIRRIPDGTYHGSTYMYYDGVTPGSRYRIVVTVTVAGDTIRFDYTGTDGQSPGFANAAHNASVSALLATFLHHVDPAIPHNEGMLRPISFFFPSGTVLNASFPAATTFGNHITDPHSETILEALSQAIPETVSAPWNRMLGATVAGRDPRRNAPFVDILFLSMKGGAGGTQGLDGYDHIGIPMRGGGITAQDPEIFEVQNPLFLEQFEYARDSAGAGRWRGGLGVDTIFTFQAENSSATIFGDGDVPEAAAHGLFGGLPGTVNRIALTYPDGHGYVPRSKEVIREIPAGTVFTQHAGGGGGFGDPFERPVEAVQYDVRCGYVSMEHARSDYGVVIDPTTGAVDQAATATLRAGRRPARVVPGTSS